VRNTLRSHNNIKQEQYRLLSQGDKRGYEDTREYYHELIYDKLFSLTPKATTEVRSTIRALRDRGYMLGILTEFPYETKLERLGLRQSDFAIIINLEDYGILKPRKECFSILIKKSRLKPEEIVYVGDRLDTDVIGANGSGIKSCIISKRYVAQADYSIRSIDDIIKALDKAS
jgi:putative hydrolase of the HAD superfamily